MSKSTERKVDRMKTLIAEGITRKDACKKAGLNLAYSYQVAPAMGAKRPKQTLTKAEPRDLAGATLQPQVGPAFLIFGSPRQLAEFARNYR